MTEANRTQNQRQTGSDRGAIETRDRSGNGSTTSVSNQVRETTTETLNGIREVELALDTLLAEDPEHVRRWQDMFASLANHHYFRLLWIGTLGSFAAMQMQQVARGNLAYELARVTAPELAATLLGVVSLSMAAPMLLFSVFGGLAADRWPKRNIVIASQSLMALLSIALAALIYLDLIALWHLVVAGLVQGTAFAFNGPARQSLLPQLTGAADMTNGIALNNAGMSATRVGGPALAGMLIALPLLGFAGVFMIIAACYVWALVLLLRIPAGYHADGDDESAEDRWGHRSGAEIAAGEGVLSGFRYMFASPVLRTAMLMGTIPVLVGMPVATLLMPVFARALLGDGYSAGLGLMFTAAGVGSLIGSFFVASLGRIQRRALLQMGIGFFWGVSLCILGLGVGLVSYPLTLVALAIAGFAGSAYGVLNQTLVFDATEPALFGRIMGIYMMSFSLFPVVSLPAGFVADRVGPAMAAVGAGGIVIAFVILMVLLNPSFGKLPANAAPSP
ncbi:MAG: MFS transporter [Chloroflexi bacterium]|nr:MFS transporter [Chloroflexota bacterium]